MESLLFSKLPISTITGNTSLLDANKLDKTKSSLLSVLSKFLVGKGLTAEDITLVDGFYFIFDNAFAEGWDDKDWWDQREELKVMQANSLYREKTISLLKHSIYRDHYIYQVRSIPDQDDHMEQYASRRERLHLKEGYENVIDSMSHAAYFRSKFSDFYPALLQILFTDNDEEEILIIDNGFGKEFHKPYRRITPWRILFKAYKLIMNKGAYYIGGMHLGLKVTYGRLSCFGDGAVVVQAPFKKIY